MLDKIINYYNNIDLDEIYNFVIQKGGGENLKNYFAIIGILLFAVAYVIHINFTYLPRTKGTIIDANLVTKEYLISLVINNNKCNRLLKNPNKEYKINDIIDIKYNPDTLEISESNEYFYNLNIIIVVTAFVFILIYFCYDLFSKENNNSNNIELNNLSYTDNNNLYIYRTR